MQPKQKYSSPNNPTSLSRHPIHTNIKTLIPHWDPSDGKTPRKRSAPIQKSGPAWTRQNSRPKARRKSQGNQNQKSRTPEYGNRTKTLLAKPPFHQNKLKGETDPGTYPNKSTLKSSQLNNLRARLEKLFTQLPWLISHLPSAVNLRIDDPIQFGPNTLIKILGSPEAYYWENGTECYQVRHPIQYAYCGPRYETPSDRRED